MFCRRVTTKIDALALMVTLASHVKTLQVSPPHVHNVSLFNAYMEYVEIVAIYTLLQSLMSVHWAGMIVIKYVSTLSRATHVTVILDMY